MNWILDNWYILIAVIVIGVAVIMGIAKFTKMPTDEQVAKIKELILLWVAEAEKELGSGTGQLKLRYVYNLFTNKFPALAEIVPFEIFSEWVDEKLVEFEEMLKVNKNVKYYIEG